MKIIDKIALLLIIIGAINWGLIGIFNLNLVDTIFGTMSVISRIIYVNGDGDFDNFYNKQVLLFSEKL